MFLSCLHAKKNVCLAEISFFWGFRNIPLGVWKSDANLASEAVGAERPIALNCLNLYRWQATIRNCSSVNPGQWLVQSFWRRFCSIFQKRGCSRARSRRLMFQIHVVKGYDASNLLDSHRNVPVHVVVQPSPQKKLRDSCIKGSCR